MKCTPEILYVDNHLLALYKPPGLLTQPSGTKEESLECWGKEWIKKEFSKPGDVFLQAVHRIDRPVCGVVLFARTSKALKRLQKYLREGLCKKTYWALVEGHLNQSQGRLRHLLVHGNHRARVVSSQVQGAKEAYLDYRVIKELEGQSLLEIQLLTGRYHQIRAQLAAIGHPIVGDDKYGAAFTKQEGIGLCHYFLRIPHPTQDKEVLVQSPSPSFLETKPNHRLHQASI